MPSENFNLYSVFLFVAMVKCIKKPDIVKYHVWRMEKVMRECEIQTQKVSIPSSNIGRFYFYIVHCYNSL